MLIVSLHRDEPLWIVRAETGLAYRVSARKVSFAHLVLEATCGEETRRWTVWGDQMVEFAPGCRLGAVPSRRGKYAVDVAIDAAREAYPVHRRPPAAATA